MSSSEVKNTNWRQFFLDTNLRVIFLAFYAGSTYFTLLILGSAYGQYAPKIGLHSDSNFTIENGVDIGLKFGAILFLLILLSTRIFEHKHYSPLTGAVVNGSLVYILGYLSASDIGKWVFENYAAISDAVLLGICVSASSYLYLSLKEVGKCRTIDALKLQHARMLQSFNILAALFLMVIGSIFFYYFFALEKSIPDTLNSTFTNVSHTASATVSEKPTPPRFLPEAQKMLAIFSVGIMYLLIGASLALAQPYYQRIVKIEERIDELNMRRSRFKRKDSAHL